MWVATKKIDHPKFNLSPGMTIPHQNHAVFRTRLREMYGNDCIEWREQVNAAEIGKIKIEMTQLRTMTERLTKQNEQLRAENDTLRKKSSK